MANSGSRGSTVVGVFRDSDKARDAIEGLKDAGFDADAISILAPDKRATRDIAAETGSHAAEGATTGAVAGGILGGLGGWLVGIGALAIPGVGPFIAAGAFATALGGAALGAGLGAIAGALVGMGVPEEEARYYEGEAKAGRTLVTVRAGSRYDEAQRILRGHGAYDVESEHAGRAAATTTQSSTGAARGTPDRDTVQLREEELVARKERVETGRVELGKDVVEEQRTLDVPVTREEVTVERRPVDRRPADKPIGDDGQSISVPVHEEQVDVDKRAVVYEEVGVAKRQVQDTERVSATVRREEARIDREGDVRLDTAGTGWAEAMPTYRQQWQSRYGASGGRWDDAEPGYRYGYEMSSRPEYRGRAWADAEPDLQRDWGRQYPDKPWDRVKDSIRETWDNARGR